MQSHIKRLHGRYTKVDAAKVLDELHTIQDARLQQKEQKKRRLDSESQTGSCNKKQKTIADSLTTKYDKTHPQHKKITNSMVAMLCLDGQPVNTVARDGFTNMVKTLDPRYKVPAPNTFSRSLIPKAKKAVDCLMKKKMENVLKNESSIAFSSDGLDGHDADRSSIYDFSVYFFEKSELKCETLFLKKLETPVTAAVIKTFLTDCLKGIGLLSSDGKPLLSIWGVTDEGSNLLCALRQMKNEKTIEGFHNCVNHKMQNVIKDAIKVSSGMESTIKTFQKNAEIYSRSRNERKNLQVSGI